MEEDVSEEGETVWYTGNGRVFINTLKEEIVRLECPCHNEECMAPLGVGVCGNLGKGMSGCVQSGISPNENSWQSFAELRNQV